MNKKRLLYIVVFLFSLSNTYAQDDDLSNLFKGEELQNEDEPVYATFKSTSIVNSRSNEIGKKNEIVFIVSHKFGDIGGESGGAQTFFGTDNSADIKLAFDYGLTDDLSIGISRAKGATAIRQLVEFNGKYKLLKQTTKNIPLSITLFGNAVVSTMSSNVNTKVPDYFGSFSDRWSFVGQVIITKKFNSNLSLALIPSYVHYNRVGYGDVNDHFSLGIGGRIKVTKRMAIIADYFYGFNSASRDDFYDRNGLSIINPLGVGLELETGGHVFQITFMNNTAILENQFLPYTTTEWEKGQFRWGFSISRPFALSKKKK